MPTSNKVLLSKAYFAFLRGLPHNYSVERDSPFGSPLTLALAITSLDQ